MIIRPPGADDLWMEVNALPIVDSSGHLEQVVVTFIDVTEAHLYTKDLARAEEEARLTFERSNVATCLVSNEGRIIRANAAICELLGRSEAELLAMSFIEVTHPDDANMSADLVADLLAGRRSSLRVTKRYVTGTGTRDLGRRHRLSGAQPGRQHSSSDRADRRRHPRAHTSELACGSGADR